MDSEPDSGGGGVEIGADPGGIWLAGWLASGGIGG